MTRATSPAQRGVGTSVKAQAVRGASAAEQGSSLAAGSDKKHAIQAALPPFWSWVVPLPNEDDRVSMAKVSIWLHWLAGLLALALMAIPPTGIWVVERITPLALGALVFSVAIHYVQWDRLDRRWFLGVSLMDIGLIGAGVAFTDGATSRYQLLFFLVVVFAAYFYTIPEAAFITAVTIGVFSAPLIYSNHVPSWSVPMTAGTLGVMVLVAAVTKETVLRVDHERDLRDRLENERIRLYEEEVHRRTSLQQKTRQLESILEMGNAFRLQLGLDALLARIASAIAEAGGFRAVVVRLFDPDTGAALCRAVYGVDWNVVAHPTPPELIRSLMDAQNRVSRSYLVEVHPSELEDPEKKPYYYVLPGMEHSTEPGRWKRVNSLIVPLETREHGLIGIISIDEPIDGKIPSVETIQTLEIFANLAATAIDNARLLEEASQAQALRELDRLKSEFLAAISHDLRTPLTIIKGSIDLLEAQEEGFSEIQSRLVAGIGKNTSRLMAMVEQLLEMIQLQHGRIELNRRLADIREVVTDTVDSLALSVRSHQQWINVRQPDSPLLIRIDRERIQQVLTNLINNASKYGPQSEEIEVSVEAIEEGVKVCVRDQGPPIPSEEQRRIFEKFYRSSNHGARAEGTGLGLAICQSLVELHGGHIWVDSRSGRGTTFAFTLPTEEGED